MSVSGKYYHSVRGKRKLCRLWLPPDSDAYWHMCGDPEGVVALSIPTAGGPVVLGVRGRDHAMQIESVMKELKVRAQRGDLGLETVAGKTDSVGFVLRYYMSPRYNIKSKSKEFDALRGYGEYQVRRAAGPRGGRPRRRPVHVQTYARRRYYIKERDVRPQHKVWVGSEKWPSQVGMSHLRRHRKRAHPRAFRASIRKGVATRKTRREGR